VSKNSRKTPRNRLNKKAVAGLLKGKRRLAKSQYPLGGIIPGRVTMNDYYVHFIDRKNFVFALEELLSFNDAEAILEIRERRLPPYCAGFELWRGERLVYRGVVKPPAAGRTVPAAPEPLQAVA
jgi:hypothetical protein